MDQGTSKVDTTSKDNIMKGVYSYYYKPQHVQNNILHLYRLHNPNLLIHSKDFNDH